MRFVCPAFATGFSLMLAAGCYGAAHGDVAASAPRSPQLPLPPVAAPEGQRWVLNAPYSDEFDGTELDRDKWHDHYPGWKGRVPGLFVPEALSVRGGMLHIQSGVLDPPRGDQGEWTIQCGAVQTKARAAHYGYYETRVKASNLTTSTTFWLKNLRDDEPRPHKVTELDILECIGDAQRWPAFADHMLSNTHLEYGVPAPGEEPVVIKKGDRSPVGGRVADGFHTYGCWWVDAVTMHFFLDGERVHTVELPTDTDPTPMDQPMFVNLVCEIYNWEVQPKTADLLDNTRNTTSYDYVRAWRLEPVE